MPRIGPMPGWVMTSTKVEPGCSVSAANWSRVTCMDLICALGGSCWPSKPSTRMIAPGPATSSIWLAITVGSSDSACNLLLVDRQAERVGWRGRRPPTANPARPSRIQRRSRS